jgi:glutamate:Na+ symporter, ESS family
MDAWNLQVSLGDLLIDFSIIGALLLAGTWLRRWVPFFQRFLIPNSLIAGFLGLLLGNELLALLPFDSARMGAYVYHLLALTFICVGLFKTEGSHSWGVVNLGFMQVIIMLVQGIVGLAIGIAIAMTLVPDLNPATGILLPLGFAMGPGIAYSIGQSWTAFGYENAGSVGLTFAAIGFLIAYFAGMVLVNREVAKTGRTALPDHIRHGVREKGNRPEGSKQTFSSAAVEPFAVHLALVGAIYLVTFGVTGYLANLLLLAGLEAEVPVIWSFHFIIANALSLGCRRVVLAGKRGDWIDNGTVHRLTGSFAEFLIASSIMAISLSIAWRFALPMALICLAGGYITYQLLKWACWKVFREHQFERFIGMFAQMTGTISSGLALIRVTDPDYRSPVAQELVLSSGMALSFGFPLLILINLPFTLFNGELKGFVIVLCLMVSYLVLLGGAWYLYYRKKMIQHSDARVISAPIGKS